MKGSVPFNQLKSYDCEVTLIQLSIKSQKWLSWSLQAPFTK